MISLWNGEVEVGVEHTRRDSLYCITRQLLIIIDNASSIHNSRPLYLIAILLIHLGYCIAMCYQGCKFFIVTWAVTRGECYLLFPINANVGLWCVCLCACVRPSAYILCVCKVGASLSWFRHEKGVVSRYQLSTVIKIFPPFWSDALTFFRVKKASSLYVSESAGTP